MLGTNGIRNDSEWVKNSFFHSVRGRSAIHSKDTAKRGSTFSSAALKYWDTTPGGNVHAINARPQYTRWGDPKTPGVSASSKGMGEFYSESIDDNVDNVVMSFGIPEYNSLTAFFTSFYDMEAGKLANTGDAGGILFGLGKAAGFILTLPFQVILGVSNLYTRVVAAATGKPYSKYYYLKPTMPLYWSAVSNMVNMIGVNMGIVEGPDPGQVTDASKGEIAALTGSKLTYNGKGSVEELNAMLPDIMKKNGGIDVYAMANRAQRLATSHHAKLKEIVENGGSIESYVKSLEVSPKAMSYGGEANLPDYLEKYYKAGAIGQGVGAKDLIPDIKNDGSKDDKKAAAGAANEPLDTIRTWDEAPDYLGAEMRDGSAFVSFAVDYGGGVSESFSNSAKSSEIEGMMNGMSSKGRATNFNLAGGNLGDGVIASAVEGVIGGVKDIMAGMAANVNLSGLSALGGAAYVNIPDFWDTASATLPKSTYTIRLATPYGNKLSIMTNIYIPLACLLAGALPRATGKNSYTSPFLCRLHHQGKNVVKLGMIDSISITRGVSGIGWTPDGLPTAVDVSFSVLNLEKIMAMPISDVSGVSDLLSLSMFDEDSAMTDYMTVLGGLNLYDTMYLTPRLSLAWRQQMAKIEAWASPSSWASSFRGSTTGRALSMVYKGMDRELG